MAEAILSTKSLQISIAGRVVARLPDLQLTAGTVVGIAGESGSGKTLAGLVLAGLIDEIPSVSVRGEVKFRGIRLTGQSHMQSRILRGYQGLSWIGQDFGAMFNPLRRIGAHLLESFADRAVSKIRKMEQIHQALAAEGLEAELANRFPHELSGGQIQRAGLALAELLKPSVLVADEPSSALDAEGKKLVMERLKTLSLSGAVIVLISHDLSLLARYASKLIVLYAGKVVEHGNAELLLSSARHPYTQGLIACARGRVGARFSDFPAIEGFIGSAHSTDGCPFAPRCSEVYEKCRDAPELRLCDADTQWHVACHKAAIP